MNKEEVLAKIPDAFWVGFAGELVSVFGVGLFDEDENGNTLLLYFTGTGGWARALQMTCEKFGVKWLWDWYDSLDWIESDEFDGEMLDLIESRFIKPDEEDKSTYYDWLLEKYDP